VDISFSESRRFLFKVLSDDHGGPKGISTHIFDWLGSERYNVLPEWHLEKGIEKERLVAPPQSPFPFKKRG
jgi:hypothetical protein